MSTAIMTLLNFPSLTFRIDEWVKRLFALLLLALILLVLIAPSAVIGYAGIGDFISEKLLSRTGTGDSSLYISRDGNGPVVLGIAPTIATGDANIDIGETYDAVLHGTVSSLNGLPQADIWFVWGNTVGMTNTTTVVTATSTGDYTGNISGYDPNDIIYYQFRSSADGSVVGDTRDFKVGGGKEVGYWLLWNLLPVVIAIGAFAVAIRLSGNFIAALIAVAIALITIAMVKAILPVIWG